MHAEVLISILKKRVFKLALANASRHVCFAQKYYSVIEEVVCFYKQCYVMK